MNNLVDNIQALHPLPAECVMRYKQTRTLENTIWFKVLVTGYDDKHILCGANRFRKDEIELVSVEDGEGLIGTDKNFVYETEMEDDCEMVEDTEQVS